MNKEGFDGTRMDIIRIRGLKIALRPYLDPEDGHPNTKEGFMFKDELHNLIDILRNVEKNASDINLSCACFNTRRYLERLLANRYGGVSLDEFSDILEVLDIAMSTFWSLFSFEIRAAGFQITDGFIREGNNGTR